MKRLVFASPAEMQLITLMKGKVLTTNLIHNKNGFPLTFVMYLGGWFAKENMRREVRVGKHWIDFGNDIRRGIEVDGEAYHNDIIKEIERDEYFKKNDWRILHIKAGDILARPNATRNAIIDFLKH